MSARASDATILGIQAITSLLALVVRRRPHPTGPRVYGYRRVSTDEQVRSGLGLEDQQKAIARASVKLKLPIWRVRTDRGLSGELPPDQRPSLLLILKHIRPKDVLIVAKRDRLSRDDLNVKLLEVGLASASVRIVSAAGEGTQVGLDDPNGMLERGINDLFSKNELLVIRQRTKAALRRRRINGLRTGGIPYGFVADEDGRLVPNKLEQEALALMRKLRAEGSSYGAIAAELVERQVPPRGSVWRKSGVRAILKTDVRWSKIVRPKKP